MFDHLMGQLEGIFSEENDPFYRIGERRGLKKGEEKATQKANERMVKNLLRKTDFSIAKIADLVEVSEYFVRKIRKTINRRHLAK